MTPTLDSNFVCLLGDITCRTHHVRWHHFVSEQVTSPERRRWSTRMSETVATAPTAWKYSSSFVQHKGKPFTFTLWRTYIIEILRVHHYIACVDSLTKLRLSFHRLVFRVMKDTLRHRRLSSQWHHDVFHRRNVAWPTTHLLVIRGNPHETKGNIHFSPIPKNIMFLVFVFFWHTDRVLRKNERTGVVQKK